VRVRLISWWSSSRFCRVRLGRSSAVGLRLACVQVSVLVALGRARCELLRARWEAAGGQRLGAGGAGRVGRIGGIGGGVESEAGGTVRV